MGNKKSNDSAVRSAGNQGAARSEGGGGHRGPAPGEGKGHGNVQNSEARELDSHRGRGGEGCADRAASVKAQSQARSCGNESAKGAKRFNSSHVKEINGKSQFKHFLQNDFKFLKTVQFYPEANLPLNLFTYSVKSNGNKMDSTTSKQVHSQQEFQTLSGRHLPR